MGLLAFQIKLSTHQRDFFLRREIRGTGGFQSLLKKLQRQIYNDNLVLDQRDFDRIIIYSTKYGKGGFEDILKEIRYSIISPANNEYPI